MFSCSTMIRGRGLSAFFRSFRMPMLTSPSALPISSAMSFVAPAMRLVTASCREAASSSAAVFPDMPLATTAPTWTCSSATSSVEMRAKLASTRASSACWAAASPSEALAASSSSSGRTLEGSSTPSWLPWPSFVWACPSPCSMWPWSSATAPSAAPSAAALWARSDVRGRGVEQKDADKAERSAEEAPKPAANTATGSGNPAQCRIRCRRVMALLGSEQRSTGKIRSHEPKQP
mmetsp:Transcript_87212/g.281725  ORF Transcript_87212/g.281725 Transcript_87212/m.281725 type:complete len:234 (-) Transcript_87212:23-724(-)